VKRTVADRIASVRGLLAAARDVYARRSSFIPELVRTTGLTSAGVTLGFEALERKATDEELASLVAAAGDIARVHVVLSANVFTAPLRAIALARAAADFVSVRPSPRDPTLARAIVEAARDRNIEIGEDREVGAIHPCEVHVYGRNRTIREIRGRVQPDVIVRGHGAGIGVAIVTGKEWTKEVMPLVSDVLMFDQRGCLSPRVVFVEGDQSLAATFSEAIHSELAFEHAQNHPRGALSPADRSEATYWADKAAFAGQLFVAEGHAVCCAQDFSPVLVPPPGRHLLVVPVRTVDAAFTALAPIARHIVAVGTNDPARVRALAPAHARVSALGRMQRPPLDGPVDRRSAL
jgi:hypothetical protein